MAQNTVTTKGASVTPAGKLRPKPAPKDDSETQYAPGEYVPWKKFKPLLTEDLEPTERTAGKHFALLAPTRQGKTTLATKGIIPIYLAHDVPVLVIDSTSDPKLKKYGEKMPRWGKMTGLHRVAIDNISQDSIVRIYQALERAFRQGDIVIYIDEIRHVCDPKFLGLGKACENIWLFGGKRGVTLGGASQAPRWLPTSFYDQSQVHALFRIRDIRARKRLAEISGDTETLQEVIPALPQYHFGYVRPDGDVLTSKYQMGRSGGA